MRVICKTGPYLLEDITDQPHGQAIVRAMRLYRLSGLSPDDFLLDLVPDGETGDQTSTRPLHWAQDAEIKGDWEEIIVEAAWAVV